MTAFIIAAIVIALLAVAFVAFPINRFGPQDTSGPVEIWEDRPGEDAR